MEGLGICIGLNSVVKNTFYAWKFSRITSVPIAIKYDKYYFYLNKYTTAFTWSTGNSNEN